MSVLGSNCYLKLQLILHVKQALSLCFLTVDLSVWYIVFEIKETV